MKEGNFFLQDTLNVITQILKVNLLFEMPDTEKENKLMMTQLLSM